jgi:hypothetical protein
VSECRCGKTTKDAAYVCEDCGDKLARALGEVPWVTDELEVTVTRQKGVDYRSVGGSSGGKKPSERPSPVVWSASDARSDLKALLVAWVRFCHDERVRNQQPPPIAGPTCQTCDHRTCDRISRGDLPADNVPAMSRWLMWRVDGLLLHEIGPDAVEEITDAIAKCKRLIDVRPDKWYAGPCNAETNDIECGVDLYAKAASGDVTCSTCAATYDVAARRTWLLGAAQERLADAATLARSVSWLGSKPLNAARVRKWAERGRIVAMEHEGTKPLYRIGDAIDLLAKEAS